MFSSLEKTMSSCWQPLMSRYARMNKDDNENDNDLGGLDDTLLWCKDLGKHAFGDFSFSVVQANTVLEDQSQVETGQDATFVGVYDGHGGPEASRFISEHLFNHLIRLARENGTISGDIVKDAISATEDEFLARVRRTWGIKPLMAAVGSCCLVGVIWKGTLYVANLGDSRVVLGYLGRRRSKKIVAEQITRDHNASMEEVRRELRADHPDDPRIVVKAKGVWRIKSLIQVSRSIGDAYLKRPEFALDPSYKRFRLPEPIHRPVLRADPSIHTRDLQPNDKFLVFASDGLWEHITNQEAVEIVYNNPRSGIARRLVKSALTKAARKLKTRYDDLKKIDKGARRNFHDDITVVVIFIDHELLEKNLPVPELSVKGFIDTTATSKFSVLQGIDAHT